MRNPNLHSEVKTIFLGARRISFKNEQNKDSDGGWEEIRPSTCKIKSSCSKMQLKLKTVESGRAQDSYCRMAGIQTTFGQECRLLRRDFQESNDQKLIWPMVGWGLDGQRELPETADRVTYTANCSQMYLGLHLYGFLYWRMKTFLLHGQVNFSIVSNCNRSNDLSQRHSPLWRLPCHPQDT